jgi:tRNA-specific adenosine deaminase 3
MNPIPAITVWVAKITDKKSAQCLVKGLSEIQPLLHHLKRVKNEAGDLKIIVSLAEGTATECYTRIVAKNVPLEGLDTCSNWERVEVAQSPPLTRAQYNTAAKQWPCNFHEDKNTEKLVTGRWFNADQLETKAQWMQLSLAISHHQSDDMFLWHLGCKDSLPDHLFRVSHEAIPSLGACTGSRMGVVVVSPMGDRVIAAASIRKAVHPLHHSVMAAIDLVARSQGGGSLPITDISPTPNKEASPASYLCTDCEIYLSHEPCIMCCMALLHSRAKTVFFAESCPGGGLISQVRLHTLPSINHRFQVFQGLGPV